jgi:predicted DsbA family dithiol-disulfide isomerase
MTAGSPELDRKMRLAFGDSAERTLVDTRPVIRFIADLVCPWCYIAFIRLQRVLERKGAAMVWHPFLLNPHLPSRGVTRLQYLERRFGTVAQAQGVHRRVVQAGAREGIPFAFGAIRAQPNTVPAHALLLAAAGRGLQMETAAALFRAFFVTGDNIGELPVLIRIAAELGLTAEEAARAGESSAAAQVITAHERAFSLGIAGVPVCVLGEDHVIAGAQPSEALMALLDLERYRLDLAGHGAAVRGAKPRSLP